MYNSSVKNVSKNGITSEINSRSGGKWKNSETKRENGDKLT